MFHFLSIPIISSPSAAYFLFYFLLLCCFSYFLNKALLNCVAQMIMLFKYIKTWWMEYIIYMKVCTTMYFKCAKDFRVFHSGILFHCLFSIFTCSVANELELLNDFTQCKLSCLLEFVDFALNLCVPINPSFCLYFFLLSVFLLIIDQINFLIKVLISLLCPGDVNQIFRLSNQSKAIVC